MAYGTREVWEWFRRRREAVGLALLLAAGIALPAALREDRFPHDGLVALVLLALGVLWAFPAPTPPPAPAGALRPVSRRRRGVGFALMGLALGAGAVALARIWRQDTDPWGLWLWLAAMPTFVLGAYVLGPRAESPRPARWTGTEGLAFLALLAVGLAVRVYRLDAIPPGIFVDETNAAGDALRLLDGWNAPPFGVGWYETPLGYAYYLAGLFHLLGTTYLALKAASLIPAVLTLPALYFLARDLFGPRTALAALAFFALNRWHMTMSRWGWNEVAPPLFHVLTLAVLLRGVRTRRLGDFALAGVIMGLGMYTYLASRLVVVAVLAYLAYRALVEQGFLRRTAAGLGLFFLAYALTFAPLLTTYAQNPFTFLNRTQQVSILNDMRQAALAGDRWPEPIPQLLADLGLPPLSLRPLWQSLVRHARMFHVEGDWNPRHNLPGEPMLDPITGVLFLMGLVYALRHMRDHRYGLLVIGVTVPLLGGILTLVREAPQAYRTLGVVPFLCLLAGDALVRLTAAVARVLPANRSPRRARGAVALALGLLLAMAGWNADAFFRRWAHDPRVWAAFSPMETAVAREVARLLATHRVYLSPTLYWGSPLRFLTYRPADEGYGYHRPPYALIQPVEDLPLTEPVNEDTVFLLEPVYADVLDLFTEYYPHTRAVLVTGPRGEPLYVRLTVPGDDVSAIWGLEATYEWPGNTVQRRDATIDFTWPEDAPPAPTAPTRITWKGSLFAPRTGVYHLLPVGGLRVWVDGREWQGPRLLAKGLHRLEVVQEHPGTSGRRQARLLWQPPAASEVSPIPSTYLFTVPPPTQGLLGTYYRGESWEGPPVFTRVDRLLYFAWVDPEPLVGPFSVTWRGYLWAPTDGTYGLRLDGDDGVRLWVDGELIGESLRPDSTNQVRAQRYLRAGWHTLRVDYFQRGGAKTVALYWQPPGEREHLIPSWALWPAPPPAGQGSRREVALSPFPPLTTPTRSWWTGQRPAPWSVEAGTQ